jgi:hypothetical protein
METPKKPKLDKVAMQKLNKSKQAAIQDNKVIKK